MPTLAPADSSSLSLPLQRKALRFEVKAAGEDGAFTLYASVFNNLDRSNEIVQPGAFANLDAFVKDGWGTVNHDWQCLPVALIDSATQDAIGLKITGRFHSTPQAQACRTVVRERMAAGKSVSCSIGYTVSDYADEMRDGEQIRLLKRIELYEFSFVNLPANPLAQVTSVKSWASDLEAAFVALKEGRTLSARNRARLQAMAERLKEAAEDLGGLLAETDPSPSPQAETENETETDSAAKAASLRRRALQGRAARGGRPATDATLLIRRE